jgi:hypothetical protein
MNIKNYLQKNAFSFCLSVIILLIVIFSYYRFFIIKDYFVKYEGGCDPTTQKCFVGCEDEECLEEYYYSLVQKKVTDLNTQCGEDITDCEFANECLESDQNCSITYCEEEKDGPVCDIINEEEN